MGILGRSVGKIFEAIGKDVAKVTIDPIKKNMMHAVDQAKELKKAGSNLARITKLVDNKEAYFGNVDVGLCGFGKFNMVNIENGKGMIYGGDIEDYIFEPKDIKECTFIGKGKDVEASDATKTAMRYVVLFNDDKKAQMDIIIDKVDEFKAFMGI